MNREIYLDNSATTKPFDDVVDYISYMNKVVYGNPSSLHTKGIEAERMVKKARESISDSLGVNAKEIFFTSGGTEANNLAIRGYLEANPRKGKHIITSSIEHPSVLEVFKHLANIGYTVDYINVNSEGALNIEELKGKIQKDTVLISIMLVNNEIGSIQPVEEVIKIRNTQNKEVVLHVDAIQAYGKQRILPKKLGIDLLTLSSHKIHGPKGVGAVYVNNAVKIKPILFGGGQEGMLRSGTENVAGICGLGLAAEMIHKTMEENLLKVKALKAGFMKQISENVERYRIISPLNSSPFILNIGFEGIKSEVLLHHLEERNIFVSTGSACSSRKNIHSHVLKAMGIDRSLIEGAIRFSFSSLNSEEDIQDTVHALKEILPKIRKPVRGHI